jgi:hypothetical protein
MAKIKCFQCEKDIWIQDKFCPFCSAEQKIIPKTRPLPIENTAQEEPVVEKTTHLNHPQDKQSTKAQEFAREEPAKEEPAKEKTAKEEPAKEKTAKEKTAKEKTAKEKTAKEEPAKEKTPPELMHKKKAKKTKKPAGAGCSTILLGVAGLLILGFIVKTTFIDEKKEGIKLKGPGTYGRAPSGKVANKQPDGKSIIATIKAFKQKGQLEKAFQVAKQSAEIDDKNHELLTILLQLAQERNEKAGNRLTPTSNQTTKNKAQRAIMNDLKQATAKLLNHLEYPCQSVLAMGQTDKKGELVATCSPNQRGNSTVRYALDTNKGAARAE